MPKPTQAQGNPTRRVFDSPYTIKWPQATEEQQLKIIASLKDILPEIPPKKPKTNIQKKSKKKKTEGGNTEPSTAPQTITQTQPSTTTEYSIWKEFYVGVNRVTKGIENDQVRIVLVGIDVSDQLLINHLLIMCKMKSITICPVLSAQLGSIFGKRSVAAAAVKKQDDTERVKNDTIEEFTTMAETLMSESMDRVTIPWLATTNLHDLRTKTVGKKRGRDPKANQNPNPNQNQHQPKKVTK